MTVMRFLPVLLLAPCSAMMSFAQGAAAPMDAEAETDFQESIIDHSASSTFAADMDERLTNIALEISDISAGEQHLAQTYMIMMDACETARKNGVSSLSEVNETWQGAYCSCDALLTFEDWLNDPAMNSQLVTFNTSPTQEALNGLLSKYLIFAHDSDCRKSAEGRS